MGLTPHIFHHARKPRKETTVYKNITYEVPGTSTPAPTAEELLNLYNAVGWSAYTQTPKRLVPMLEGSRYAYIAWVTNTGETREPKPRQGRQLVGLVRAVGDGQSVAYLQDLLVHPQAQKNGIGSELLRHILSDINRDNIRQRFITTDAQDRHVVALYRHFGFTPVHENGCVTLAQYR